ncbi:hypothetical protein GCM10010524_57210 [Streptomyces mexicanus]
MREMPPCSLFQTRDISRMRRARLIGRFHMSSKRRRKKKGRRNHPANHGKRPQS